MDPIKVDFTKKKDDGIIIKPAKAGLKIFLNILITLVGAGIAYYIMLPPMNFKSTDNVYFLCHRRVDLRCSGRDHLGRAA